MMFNSLIRQIFSNHHRKFTTTNVLLAEPLRKRRRLDPAVLRLRTERKIVKVEREIARIEKQPRQLIPILECQITNIEKRKLATRPGRTLEQFGINENTVKAAQRLWNFYRLHQSFIESRSLRRIQDAQKFALKTLKDIDEELYNSTIAVDQDSLIPHVSKFMRKDTPPNPNHTPPDGRVIDVTKKWIM